jgi:hypothetical protein
MGRKWINRPQCGPNRPLLRSKISIPQMPPAEAAEAHIKLL